MGTWKAILQVTMPCRCWCSQINDRFPLVQVEVESFLPRSPRERIETVSLEGEEARAAGQAMAEVDCVDELEVLEETGRRARLRVRSQGPCPLSALVEATGLPAKLPFRVRDGCGHWLLIAGC